MKLPTICGPIPSEVGELDRRNPPIIVHAIPLQRVVRISRSIEPADLMELEEIERGLSEVSSLCRHVTDVGVEPKA